MDINYTKKLFHFRKIKKFLQTHLFPRNSSVFLQPFMDRLSAWLTLLLSPGLLLTQHMSSGFDFHPVTLHLYSSRKHPVQIWLALFQSCLTQLSITPNRDNHLPTMIGHCYLAFNTTNFWLVFHLWNSTFSLFARQLTTQILKCPKLFLNIIFICSTSFPDLCQIFNYQPHKQMNFSAVVCYSHAFVHKRSLLTKELCLP